MLCWVLWKLIKPPAHKIQFCIGERKISNLFKIFYLFFGLSYTPNRRRAYKHLGLCRRPIPYFHLMFLSFCKVVVNNFTIILQRDCNKMFLLGASWRHFRIVWLSVRLSTWTPIGWIIFKFGAGVYCESLSTHVSFVLHGHKNDRQFT